MKNFWEITLDNIIRSSIIVGTNFGVGAGIGYLSTTDSSLGAVVTAVTAAIYMFSAAKYSAISSIAHYIAQDESLPLNIAGNLIPDACIGLYDDRNIEFGLTLIGFDCVNLLFEAGINHYLLQD